MAHGVSHRQLPMIDAFDIALGGAVVTTLGVYRKHVGKYVSERSVDRTTELFPIPLYLQDICWVS